MAAIIIRRCEWAGYSVQNSRVHALTDDQMFRTVLLIVLIVTLPIGVYHRFRSQATREPLDRMQEGLFILIAVRLSGLVVWLGVAAFLIDPASMAWSSLSLPLWLRWTGVGIGVLAAALMFWTMRRLGKNLTDTVVTRREHTLVTQGPYRWVRHPFYDSAAMFVIGIALLAANCFILATGAFAIGVLVLRTRIEEEKLLARFGDPYRAYMARTGRFLPKLGA
jgi:protein-S-isoprenylcysteine O-methyltransferase Ste14